MAELKRALQETLTAYQEHKRNWYPTLNTLLLDYGIGMCWKCVCAKQKIHDELHCDTKNKIDVTFDSAYGIIGHFTVVCLVVNWPGVQSRLELTLL